MAPRGPECLPQGLPKKIPWEAPGDGIPVLWGLLRSRAYVSQALSGWVSRGRNAFYWGVPEQIPQEAPGKNMLVFCGDVQTNKDALGQVVVQSVALTVAGSEDMRFMQ